MANTQLTTIPQGGALAAPLGHLDIEGMEGLTQSDIILPRWGIIQPTSQKEGADQHLGQFVRNIDGVFAPQLDVVILQIAPARLLWSGDLNDRKPECFSRDGQNGSRYGPCLNCEFNIQTNPSLQAARQQGSLLKICSFGYNYILVDDLAENSLALIGAMGTSVRPAKVLNTQFAMKHRPPFSAIVSFTTDRVVNDKGKFYVLKAAIKSWLSPEDTAKYRARYMEVKGATIREVDEDAVTDAPDAPPMDNPPF